MLVYRDLFSFSCKGKSIVSRWYFSHFLSAICFTRYGSASSTVASCDEYIDLVAIQSSTSVCTKNFMQSYLCVMTTHTLTREHCDDFWAGDSIYHWPR